MCADSCRPRRALEIAAVGGHHLLLMGPPGTGKTMLAERLPGILPPMTESDGTGDLRGDVGGRTKSGSCPLGAIALFARRITPRPRSLLWVGGSQPRPGEISLAHNGVLFLDEFPEFSRHVLEVLREPMESGQILISRAARQLSFPRAIPVGGGDESLSLRLRRRHTPALPLHAGSGAALSFAYFRSAARSHRSMRPKCLACHWLNWSAAQRARRRFGHGTCARHPCTSARACTGRALECRDQYPRTGARTVRSVQPNDAGSMSRWSGLAYPRAPITEPYV